MPAVTPPIQDSRVPEVSTGGAWKALDTVLQASGLDLQTGRVVDTEKFHRWKKQHAQSASVGRPVSNASLFETFRKARTSVEGWVDEESNRLCILESNPEEIKRKPEIQAILNEYAGYGLEMREKLLRHLEFMIENRRKYYKALEERRTGGRPG